MRRMPTNEQVDELQKMIEGGGAGGGGVFYAIVGTTTLAEINQAWADGKFVIAVRKNPTPGFSSGFGYLLDRSGYGKGAYTFIEEACIENDYFAWRCHWDEGVNTGTAKKIVKLFLAEYVHTPYENTLTYKSPILTHLEFTNLLETTPTTELSNIILRLRIQIGNMSGFGITAIGRLSRLSVGGAGTMIELIYTVPGTEEYSGEYRIRCQGTGEGTMTITKIS